MGVYRLKFPCESAFLIRIQITFYLEKEFGTTCIILICFTFLEALSSCPSQCLFFSVFMRVSRLLWKRNSRPGWKRNLQLGSKNTHSTDATSPSPETMWSWGQQGGSRRQPRNPLFFHSAPTACQSLCLSQSDEAHSLLCSLSHNKTKPDPSAQGFAAESSLCPVFRSSLPWKRGGQSCDDKESVFGQWTSCLHYSCEAVGLNGIFYWAWPELGCTPRAH